MKPYTVQVDIDLPRDRVVELFEAPDNLFFWQTGLVSYEHLSGEPGQPGAQARLTYDNGRRFWLLETIVENNLPDVFHGSYEWGSNSNTLRNEFVILDAGRTRWLSTCDYTFGSLGMKFFGFFFPGMFRKQNLIYLKNFKAFAERGHDVREQGNAE